MTNTDQSWKASDIQNSLKCEMSASPVKMQMILQEGILNYSVFRVELKPKDLYFRKVKVELLVLIRELKQKTYCKNSGKIVQYSFWSRNMAQI